MRRASLAFGLAGALSLLAACGDGSSSSGTSTGNAAGSGGTGGAGAAGASGGAGGTGGAAGGTGGAGGAGGSADIDPLEGAGTAMVVQGGFQFTEGPQWIPASDTLLFSDIPADTIHELVPPAQVSVFVDGSSNTNGIGLAPDGTVITCEHSGRRVARLLGDKSTETIADSYTGKKLNSPNDVVVRSDGNIYFTDPPYGLPNPNQSELQFNGVFQVKPGGEVVLIAGDMQRPNGIALSPGEDTLYVDDTMTGEIRAYTLSEDGSAGAHVVLATTNGDNPDGMTVDQLGNVYVTTTLGIEVFRADGTYRGAIPVPEKPTNCAFGGADRFQLYVTTPSTLYVVQMMTVPGLY